MKRLRLIRLAAVLLALSGLRLAGDVVPAPLFVDGAVLQRDKPLPIWGQAEAGEKVTVSFAGQQRNATAGSDGRWMVLLDPVALNVAPAELTIAGKNTVVVRDVLVGEVWLCSGQSNMEWNVARAAEPTREIAAANFPQLRHIKIERTVATTPATSVKTTGWQGATPQTVGEFTAVGYFFAREIHQKLGVPVGIINCTWGGTPIESWMSPAALASNPAFAVVGDRWTRAVAEFPTESVSHVTRLAEWTKGEAIARTHAAGAYREWLARNPRPIAPRGPGDPWTPSGLFNGMINPLVPYALRGTLWYQGENNTDRASEYHLLFATMITAWRAHFAQGDTPFFWVNLANFRAPLDKTSRNYAFLREAQTRTLALPHTGQALAIDIGTPDDIHPANKQEVGRRLALLAKHRVYDIVCDDTGPTFLSATREGAALRIRFSNAESGLLTRDRPVQALELAGADRLFYPAVGRLDGATLLVSAAAVKDPVAVRYAWSNAPDANLASGSGLPAVPFRSDEW